MHALPEIAAVNSRPAPMSLRPLRAPADVLDRGWTCQAEHGLTARASPLGEAPRGLPFTRLIKRCASPHRGGVDPNDDPAPHRKRISKSEAVQLELE